jgi:hypothetical protein
MARRRLSPGDGGEGFDVNFLRSALGREPEAERLGPNGASGSKTAERKGQGVPRSLPRACRNEVEIPLQRGRGGKLREKSFLVLSKISQSLRSLEMTRLFMQLSTGNGRDSELI